MTDAHDTSQTELTMLAAYLRAMASDRERTKRALRGQHDDVVDKEADQNEAWADMLDRLAARRAQQPTGEGRGDKPVCPDCGAPADECCASFTSPSATKGLEAALKEISELPALSPPADRRAPDFDMGARAARLEAADIAKKSLAAARQANAESGIET